MATDEIPISEKSVKVSSPRPESEEVSVQQKENVISDNDPEGSFDQVDFSHIDGKKVLRKMDLRLIPMLAVLYLLSFLDRGNIGNAKIEGLQEDLNMTGGQYNWTCNAPSRECQLWQSRSNDRSFQ